MSRPGAVAFRVATSADAFAVAGLHAASWQRHYRGSYPDAFLDGPVVDNRLKVWRDRLAQADAGTVTILAEASAFEAGAAAPELVGFVHIVLDDDPTGGALVDNLHVRHDHQGSGIGTALLCRAAQVVLEQRPGLGLSLWVLERNVDAQAFYGARGATTQGMRVTVSPGGGAPLVALRCAWPDPRALILET